MKKALLFVSALLMLLGVGRAIKIAMDSDKTTIKWHRTVMDGSRTGVKSVTVDNVDTALGTFDDETYIAPSGILQRIPPKLVRAKSISFLKRVLQ